LRQLAKAAKPKVVLSKDVRDANLYSFNSSTGVLKTQYKFRLGEEFNEVGMSGDQCKSVINFQGNTMVHLQKGENFKIFILVCTNSKSSLINLD
jgi:hypothetical protein